MRFAIKLCLAFCGLLFMQMSACEDEASSRKLGPMEPMGKLRQLKDSDGNEPNREEYIKASIEIGCIPRLIREKNLNNKGYNQAYRNILRRHRFRDRKHFLSYKSKYARDAEIRAAIRVGIRECIGIDRYNKQFHGITTKTHNLPGSRH